MYKYLQYNFVSIKHQDIGFHQLLSTVVISFLQSGVLRFDSEVVRVAGVGYIVNYYCLTLIFSVNCKQFYFLQKCIGKENYWMSSNNRKPKVCQKCIYIQLDICYGQPNRNN